MTDDTGPGDDHFGVPPGAGVGFLISQLGYVISTRFRAMLAPLGFEPRHFLVLRHVALVEGSSQQALGQALRIPASRMVGLIDDLEARGLVERRANPRDRRARALHLTTAGHEALGQAFTLAVAHERAICGDLDGGERDRLLGLLQRLTGGTEIVPGVHPGLTSEHGEDG